MASEWAFECISEVANVTDYVANGSFEALRNNVKYRSTPDYAVLVRLVDHNAGWCGDFVYVDKASYDFLRKSALAPGDIVIANVGANAGTVFRVPDLGRSMTLGPNAVLIRPKDENTLRRDFLYYYLVSNVGQESLRSILSGSAQPKFNKTDLRRLSVPVPPLPEQRAIAHILGTLDDKIELNRKQNETLEAMARALFKAWFVDFEPVRAKMEGRWQRGQSLPGLPAHLYDLFPDRLVESELGEVPEGWESGRLEDALVLQRGFDLPASAREPGPYPVMAASGVNGYHEQPMVKGPGVTTGRSGVLGRVFLVLEDFWPLNTSLWVKEFKRVSPFYAFEVLRSLDFELFNAGSAVPTLNRNHVHCLPVILPPATLVNAFDQQVVPIRRAQKESDVECGNVARLRDTLLPKLISGELRIADAEAFLKRRGV